MLNIHYLAIIIKNIFTESQTQVKIKRQTLLKINRCPPDTAGPPSFKYETQIRHISLQTADAEVMPASASLRCCTDGKTVRVEDGG